MSKQTKRGVVAYVAGTGGIKFDGETDVWYNPTKNCKDYVKPEMKGREVEITLIKETLFSFIKVVGEQNGNQNATPRDPHKEAPVEGQPMPVSDRDSYWIAKNQRDILRDKRETERQEQIGRAGALNTAVEIVRLSRPMQKKEPVEYAQDAIKLAEEVLVPWIKGQRMSEGKEQKQDAARGGAAPS